MVTSSRERPLRATAKSMPPMPLRTASRPVSAAARVGVQLHSVYMRVNMMPSRAMRSQFGMLKPRICVRRVCTHARTTNIATITVIGEHR
jgi:hypothetical protein